VSSIARVKEGDLQRRRQPRIHERQHLPRRAAYPNIVAAVMQLPARCPPNRKADASSQLLTLALLRPFG
jgi:hypothetical protein